MRLRRFPVLDATAVRDGSGAINLAVVNRDRDRDVEASIEIRGASRGVADELNAASVDVFNSWERPDDVGLGDAVEVAGP